jgi:hypothetical protein
MHELDPSGPVNFDVDSDLDGGYDAHGIESDLGDNIEILEAENPHLVQSWGHTRAMPPKKYFKEDDDDFDLQEEQRP